MEMEIDSVNVDSTVDLTINTEDDVAVEASKSKGKRPRKLTSKVWNYFEMLAEKSAKGMQRCKCKKCSATFICDSRYGTGNLKRHLKSCVRRDTRDVGQLIVGQNLTLRSTKFEVEKYRELLIAAIVMHELPLSFVEYKGIRALLHYLHPDIPMISRNTAKSDLFKMYKTEKSRMRNMLVESRGMICLTGDLWTSIATDGYLAITVHFIDNEWVLQKRLLDFSFMPPPHTGVALSEKVYSILEEWGIEKKIFSVTLDNASSNNVFVGLLKEQLNRRQALVCEGDFFHLRCCAHILNLIVQDGLKEIDESVVKLRESVKYVKGSQVRKQKFLECVKLLALDGKKGLSQDVLTRWNSTYLMLESALFYRRAFCHLELSDSNYKCCPTTIEWEKIEKICSFLGVFYEITCLFSGSKYITSNLFFPAVFIAYVTLHENLSSLDEYMRNMAEMMMAKFEKYWSEFNLTLAIAVILDHRYKVNFVEWGYSELYGNDSRQFQEVLSKLTRTFNEYVAKSVSTTPPLETSSSNYANSELISRTSCGVKDRLQRFDRFHSKDFGSSIHKTQLEQYLDEPRFERNASLNVLDFWKTNQFRYPDLAAMARDILAIPVTTVASESTFSVGGRVLDQYRSSLKPDTVQALICTRDWLFGDIDSVHDIPLDQLTEDITNLDIKSNDEIAFSATGSNSMEQDKKT